MLFTMLCLFLRAVVWVPLEQIRSKKKKGFTLHKASPTTPLNIIYAIEGEKYADIETGLCMKEKKMVRK